MLKSFIRLRYIIRNSNIYQKYFQTWINNIKYAFKNLRFYFKYYGFKKDKSIAGNTIFFILDPRLRHPGLVDRLKAAVCIYYIAKINGFNFKLIFDSPFHLSDYLEINQISWEADRSELSFSLHNSRLLAYNGTGKFPQLNKKIKQYHIYFYNGKNILQCNNIPNHENLWRESFNELFKPKLLLVNAIADQKYDENSYIAVHLRFVNALENFEEKEYISLNDNQQKNLIDRCLIKLYELKHNHQSYPIIVFSDSLKFLNIAKENKFDIIEGTVGHISFHGENNSIVLKTFLDFYMISRAKKIYRIIAPELYKSAFPYYAAMSMGKETEVINI
jgi:hypothetical protein